MRSMVEGADARSGSDIQALGPRGEKALGRCSEAMRRSETAGDILCRWFGQRAVRNNVSCPGATMYHRAMRRLDAIDRDILRELQDDGRITNVELARRVGISAPPCLRRVRSLEQMGYIKSYRALLDEKALGCEVIAFAMVHLSSQAEADLRAFEAFVRREPLVRECWMLSGEIDFILKCVAPSLTRFQALVTALTAMPHVLNVKTSLTLRNSKDAAMVPVELLRPPP
jgi:DNA-binding Lrp family transcriptional regulator